MNHNKVADDSTDANPSTEENDEVAKGRHRLQAGLVLAAVVGVILLMMLQDGDGNGPQTADMSGQGGTEPVLAKNGAQLTRRADGVVAEIDVGTPVPGSYEYPTNDLVPPWADPHPRVASGASGAPEIFTAWVFAFNFPELCTDGACGRDDLGPDAAARGGSYQLDGLIADEETMVFSGHIRVGQSPLSGAPLENPGGAEVHLAIAPHGRALPGADGWRQLNGPLGNATLWWSASFAP